MNDTQVQAIDRPVSDTQIWAEIIPELRVDESGKGYASVRGVARLCGITHPTITRQLKGGALNRSKMAKVLMNHGFEGGALERFPANGIPDKAIAIIVQYYAMDAGPNCREQAKTVLKAFLAIGIRTWMQQLTGYEPPKLEPVAEPKAVPSDEIAELRGMISLLRDELRVLTAQHQDLKGFVEFLCDKYCSLEQKIQALESVPAPEAIANNPSQLRAEIKEMVNQVAYEQDADHRVLWGKLYQAFQRTYGCCPDPEEGESRLDAFMRHDLVGPLHRVARLLFGYRAG